MFRIIMHIRETKNIEVTVARLNPILFLPRGDMREEKNVLPPLLLPPVAVELTSPGATRMGDLAVLLTSCSTG